MKKSRRSRRMEKAKKRMRHAVTLNMVSLMDIFTILVFFLLLNSSSGEVLPTTKTIRLPESIAEKPPKETLVITVNERNILVQGRSIALVSSLTNNKSQVIKELKKELDRQAQRIIRRQRSKKPFNGQVTIMGDKEIPYSLLKRIMFTCTKANYGNISLAVLKKTETGT